MEERFVTWYVTTVMLDLEAHGLVERAPKGKPQRLWMRADS
jgi:hypothetical protein